MSLSSETNGGEQALKRDDSQSKETIKILNSDESVAIISKDDFLYFLSDLTTKYKNEWLAFFESKGVQGPCMLLKHLVMDDSGAKFVFSRLTQEVNMFNEAILRDIKSKKEFALKQEIKKLADRVKSQN